MHLAALLNSRQPERAVPPVARFLDILRHAERLGLSPKSLPPPPPCAHLCCYDSHSSPKPSAVRCREVLCAVPCRSPPFGPELSVLPWPAQSTGESEPCCCHCQFTQGTEELLISHRWLYRCVGLPRNWKTTPAPFWCPSSDNSCSQLPLPAWPASLPVCPGVTCHLSSSCGFGEMAHKRLLLSNKEECQWKRHALLFLLLLVHF